MTAKTTWMTVTLWPRLAVSLLAQGWVRHRRRRTGACGSPSEIGLAQQIPARVREGFAEQAVRAGNLGRGYRADSVRRRSRELSRRIARLPSSHCRRRRRPPPGHITILAASTVSPLTRGTHVDVPFYLCLIDEHAVRNRRRAQRRIAFDDQSVRTPARMARQGSPAPRRDTDDCARTLDRGSLARDAIHRLFPCFDRTVVVQENKTASFIGARDQRRPGPGLHTCGRSPTRPGDRPPRAPHDRRRGRVLSFRGTGQHDRPPCEGLAGTPHCR